MEFIFRKNECKKIYLPQDEKESLRLAVDSLIKDIYRVCGAAIKTENAAEADIVVCSADSAEFSVLSGGRYAFNAAEMFTYAVENGKIFIFGADDLGAIFGVYTFTEQELGVSPDVLFDGVQPERVDELRIAEKRVSESPYTPFRGWFVNDEDLLSGFQSQGERNIDYFFYKKVIHPDLMDRIAETALRHRMNLLIPSTLVDIENPVEENLIAIAARRGLYVSQHHIEPLGVSHYGLKAFLKANGYDETPSFITNRQGMEAAWRHYAKKWAKYPRVFWQLGLRGASDIPVWVTDKNVGSTDKERGALISDAIFTQYKIIQEEVGGKIHTSMTVWMESAKLLGTGNLDLPEDTTVVFSDVGASQMFGDDFFSLPRKENTRYGVYYHAGYWNVGPHLAEGVNPWKMEYCYRLARKERADNYSVLNVANVKEFIFSIGLNAKILWYGEGYSANRYLEEYCARYGAEASCVKEGITTYYSAFCDGGEAWYKDFCQRNNFHYHAYTDLPFPTFAINDGWLCWFIRRPFEDKVKFFDPALENSLVEGVSRMEQAYALFEKLGEKLPIEKREPFLRGWQNQAHYWKELFKAGLEVFYAVKKVAQNTGLPIDGHYAKAAACVEKILSFRKAAYETAWTAWFSFDKKLDIPGLYEFLKTESEKRKA